MATYKQNDLTIVDHETDPMTSVSRANVHLGLIFPSAAGFDARPSAPLHATKADATFATKRAAIDYLAA